MDEEGTYGAAPRQPGMPPASPAPRVRERKPKIYSSYAVDSDCEAHGKKVRSLDNIFIFELQAKYALAKVLISKVN